MKRVLFIDVRNTARSPMAEAWFNSLALGWGRASSCGTMPAQLFDMPAGYRTVELQEAIREVMMASMGAASMPQGMPPNLPPDIAARINAARQKGASTKSH